MSALPAWDVVPASPVPARRPGRAEPALRPGRGVPAHRPGRGVPARARHLRLVPPPAPAAREARAAVRVTRMGRLVATVVLAGLLVLLTVTVTARAAAPSAPEHTVTVRAGQTLSEVAAAELPQLPIAEGVARLQLANRLPSVQVRAGQQLLVPAVG